MTDRSGRIQGRRVCFLYIAQAHQVLHSLSVAVELARGWPQVQVEVAAVTQEHLAYVTELLAQLGGAPIALRLLGPSLLRAWREKGVSTPRKVPMLLANARPLDRYDAIVAPERTTAVLRKFGMRRPKLVYTQHGAGDRAGPFEPRLRKFDLVFAAGHKQWDRMVAEGLVAPERCVIVGYPKFDLVDDLAQPLPSLFAEPRPVVLYNPHFDAGLSSWPRWGEQVLAAFAKDSRYNLVFAPHVRLFDGVAPDRAPQLRPYLDHPAIHIDLGSRAAFDMTYTRMADVYLGDVSSQIYEFIREPRPCLFLNAHQVAWQGSESYRHWRLGPVLETPQGLVDAVDQARARRADHHDEQVESFRYSFDLEGPRASRRAAEAIAGLALAGGAHEP